MIDFAPDVVLLLLYGKLNTGDGTFLPLLVHPHRRKLDLFDIFYFFHEADDFANELGRLLKKLFGLNFTHRHSFAVVMSHVQNT